MKDNVKELLLRNICSRLPYGVKLVFHSSKGDIPAQILRLFSDTWDISYTPDGKITYLCFLRNAKLYLRPMSSMTEGEKQEMHRLLSPTGTATYQNTGIATPVSHFGDFIPYEYMARVLNWLNAHHFDYDGLIEKGLALEAPKGIY